MNNQSNPLSVTFTQPAASQRRPHRGHYNDRAAASRVIAWNVTCDSGIQSGVGCPDDGSLTCDFIKNRGLEAARVNDRQSPFRLTGSDICTPRKYGKTESRQMTQ
jgi:hypothetical protein